MSDINREEERFMDDEPLFGEEPSCHYCLGEGYIYLDMDMIDDPINMCDWASGVELGDIVKCTCCGGSGLAKDCKWW